MLSRITRYTPPPIPTDLSPIRSQLKAIQDILTLERSDPIIQIGQIDSLGGSVAPGVVGGVVDMTAKGRTGRNLIENGDFAEGIAGWAPTYGVLSVIDNVAIIVGDGSASSIWLENTLHGREADRSYYGVCLARVRDSTCDTLRIVVAGGGVKSVENPVNDRWYVLPAKHTAIGDHNKLIAVQAIYPDAATANGKTLEVQEVSAIDLDAENLTGKTADEINTMFPDWFDGTQSTGPKRKKIAGKNLLDISRTPDIIRPNTEIVQHSDKIIVKANGAPHCYVIFRRKLKPNTQYTAQKINNIISGSSAAAGTLAIYTWDVSTIILGVGQGSTSGIFTTPADGRVSVILYASSVSADTVEVEFYDVQIEEGTTVTAYEEYKESLAYSTKLLRSLPNGVADRINFNEGVKIKNVEEDTTVLKNAGPWGAKQELTNTILFQTNLTGPLNHAIPSGGHGIVTGPLRVDDAIYPAKGSSALWSIDIEGIGVNTAGTMNLRIAKSKLTTIDSTGLEAYLQSAGQVIFHYQLAQPEIIQLDIPPQSLLSFENGTLIQEHVVGEVTFYSASCLVSDVNYPIQSLDFVRKVDLDTGAATDIDVSTAVIAGDGLSFTHPDLAVGDLVDWDYYYPSELSTLAELEYTVPLANVKSSIIRTQQVTTKNADYTIAADDYIILVDGSTAAVNVTLPTALVAKNLNYKIKAVNITNVVKVITEGAETIDGATDHTFSAANEVVEVVGDGANWAVV